ncbi:uncharacterized protein PRD47_004367 [Ara ararauna]
MRPQEVTHHLEPAATGVLGEELPAERAPCRARPLLQCRSRARGDPLGFQPGRPAVLVPGVQVWSPHAQRCRHGIRRTRERNPGPDPAAREGRKHVAMATSSRRVVKLQFELLSSVDFFQRGMSKVCAVKERTLG